MACIDFESVFSGISRAAYYHVANGLDSIESQLLASYAEHFLNDGFSVRSLNSNLPVVL